MTAPVDGLNGVAAETTAASEPSAVTETVASDPTIRERYHVVRTIAREADGALYLARRADTDALVELRVLSGRLGADRVLLSALMQHATLVSRIAGEGPGIATLYECERTGNGLVLAMAHP